MKSSRNRQSTYFIKYPDFIQNLKNTKDEERLETLPKNYARYQLLHIDEIGYLPIQPGNTNLLFQIIYSRYEKQSAIITSNINFDKRATILHDKRLANAIVYHVFHHTHVINITGDSYRLRNHLQQKE
ncbi:ATP-binding protein [Veillonella sp.]|uniref:ATP-binding protein n=1 Tax=Veillonella sp. TaxID=1926307 RepID=UPI0025F24F54|nr:ATP-binding protein [Veillonella sp.]